MTLMEDTSMTIWIRLATKHSEVATAGVHCEAGEDSQGHRGASQVIRPQIIGPPRACRLSEHGGIFGKLDHD